MTKNTLICDLGSYTGKYSLRNGKSPYKFINSKIKQKKSPIYYFSNQFEEIHDCTTLGFVRPMDSGYLTNETSEALVLEHFLVSTARDGKSKQLSANTTLKPSFVNSSIMEYTIENFLDLKTTKRERKAPKLSNIYEKFVNHTETPFTKLDIHEPTSLFITEHILGIPPLEENLTDLLFNKLKFDKICIDDPKAYVLHTPVEVFNRISFLGSENKPEAARTTGTINGIQEHVLVIDSGFSFTRIMLFKYDTRLRKHVFDKYNSIQIDVGGKALTEKLSEMLSYQKIDLSNDFMIVNDIKESICSETFMDIKENLKLSHLDQKSEEQIHNFSYVLPNKIDVLRGFPLNTVKNEEDRIKYLDHEKYDSLLLENELYRVTEGIFRPSDLNIEQMGISEAVTHLINTRLNENEKEQCLRNIFCVGGNFNIKNAALRVGKEVKSYFYDKWNVNVYFRNNVENKRMIEESAKKLENKNIAIDFKQDYKFISSEDLCWIGMHNFVNSTNSEKHLITRKTSEEAGHYRAREIMRII